MPIALATSSRALLGATLASAVLVLFPGCGEQSIERRGGGEIPDLVAGSPPSAGSSSVAGTGQPSEAGTAGANEGSAAGANEGGAAGAP